MKQFVALLTAAMTGIIALHFYHLTADRCFFDRGVIVALSLAAGLSVAWLILRGKETQ